MTNTSAEDKPTIAEDGEPQEGQIALSLYGVPAQVWVALSKQHGAGLKATACQVCDHLHTQISSFQEQHKRTTREAKKRTANSRVNIYR